MNTDELMRPLRAAVRAQLGAAPGAVIAISQGNDVHIEAVGSATLDGNTPLSADALFRISSMTKPLVAALAMMLVEDGVFGLADPIERWLPELTTAGSCAVSAARRRCRPNARSPSTTS